MKSQGDDEEQLISRAQQGDQHALEMLWVVNRRWVAAVILAHRPRSVAVEDLMQDVAVKYISKIDTLREAAAFRGWLRRIAVNICRGAARQQRPTVKLATGDHVEEGEVSLPASDDKHGRKLLEHCDAAERVYRNLASLPTEYSEPLILRAMQELTYQQISDMLELPVTTIETRIARARRMLRDELDGNTLAGDVG